MPIIQVSRVGTSFAVLEDGAVASTHTTRGGAIAAALKLKG